MVYHETVCVLAAACPRITMILVMGEEYVK